VRWADVAISYSEAVAAQQTWSGVSRRGLLRSRCHRGAAMEFRPFGRTDLGQVAADSGFAPSICMPM
jgi:hypothetical protein